MNETENEKTVQHIRETIGQEAYGFKGSSDPSHFIFEINVGKSRIRHTTTLKLNDEFRLKIDWR